MKKFLALVLSLCMVFSLAAVASAAEIDADGGSGSTPVYLSSTADGSIGGDPAPTAMSVTIPTGLPMAMSQSGDVTTADNCQIEMCIRDSCNEGCLLNSFAKQNPCSVKEITTL